jgi:hypothetical protein
MNLKMKTEEDRKVVLNYQRKLSIWKRRIMYSVVDRRLVDADPDTDWTLNFDADSDPDLDPAPSFTRFGKS